MKTFETRIIKTWKPSKWLRTLGIILLLVSAFIVYIWDHNIPGLKTFSYIIYAISFLFALSLSFIHPKNIGEISISEEKIQIELQGDSKVFLISDLDQLGFDNRGYAGFWNHILQNGKEHLYFKEKSGEKFDYEISIQNIENKEALKHFLNTIKETTNIKMPA